MPDNDELDTLIQSLTKDIAELKTKSDANNTEQVNKIQASIDKTETEIKQLSKAVARRELLASTVELDANENQVKFAKAWDNYARKGIDIPAEIKQLNLTTGDNLVPEVIELGVQEYLRKASPIREHSNVVQISTTAFNKNVATGKSAGGWVAETGSRVVTNTPTYGRISITAHELYANPEVSNAVLEDSGVDLAALLSMDMADTFVELEGEAFISGSGTNQPFGLNTFHAAASGTAASYDVIKWALTEASAAISADDIINMIYSLNAKYRSGAAFYMNRLTLASIRLLKDSNGDLFSRGDFSANGIIGTILGFPVYEIDDMPDVAASAYPIYFGDMRRGYQIVDRRGIVSVRNAFSVPGMTQFYTSKRLGGGLLDGNALKALKIKV